MGLSIASAVVNNTVLGNLPAGVTGNEALLFGAGEKLSSEQMRGLVEAYMKGLRIVFVLVCPLMGACLVSSFLLVDVELAGVREEGGVVAVAAAGKSYVDIEVGRDESASDVEKQGEIIEGGKG